MFCYTNIEHRQMSDKNAIKSCLKLFCIEIAFCYFTALDSWWVTLELDDNDVCNVNDIVLNIVNVTVF